MDKVEASSLLKQEIARYRSMTYTELQAKLDETNHIDVVGSSGTNYQVDISIVWDDKPDGGLRIMGSIDDGGFWRTLSPHTDGFILRSDGTFVGE